MRSSNSPSRKRAFRVLAAIGFGLLALSQGAHAEVYKCVNGAGATEFSDAPCGQGRQGQKVEVKPNTIDTSGAREQALKAENQRLLKQLEAAPAGGPAAAPTAAPEAARIDSFACKQARRELEITASSIDKDSAMLRARQSAMYGTCGLREPDQQTTNIRIQNGPNRMTSPEVPKPQP